MNTRQNDLPIKDNLSLIHVFSFLIVVLMTVVSVGGIQYRTLIYPTQELIQTFVPNDVVNLFIGLPILLGSMYLAWRGKLIGLLCWTGALFFVFYNYMAYIFAMPLNWAFLSHLVLAVFSMYTLIGLVTNIDGRSVQQRLSGTVPEKFAGGVLTGLGLLFFLRVIGVLANAISSGTSLTESELVVNISDFLITPAWVIGGILLWQRKAFGYVTGLGLLFQGSMLFIALIVFLLLQPILTATPFSMSDVIVIFAMGSICFIPFALFMRGAGEA
ncbi:MAG: hypothetical protein HGA79_00385 [Anaerolineales bacterium]|nr:hypothetical protein [Anaerolineales bacterium]